MEETKVMMPGLNPFENQVYFHSRPYSRWMAR